MNLSHCTFLVFVQYIMDNGEYKRITANKPMLTANIWRRTANIFYGTANIIEDNAFQSIRTGGSKQLDPRIKITISLNKLC